jgi:hypothetical protein
MQSVWMLVVTAALACGCKSNKKQKTPLEEKLERISLRSVTPIPDPELVAMACELAKDFSTNEQVQSTLEVLFYDRVKLDKDPGDVKCVVDAYSAWYVANHPGSLNIEAIVRAWEHHKIASAKVVYDTLSQHDIQSANGTLPDARAADQPLAVADIPSVLADLQLSLKDWMAGADSPMDQRTPNDIPLFTSTVEKLAAIGPPAVPALLDIWLTDKQPIKIRAAAQALGRIDAPTLVKETIKALDAYDAAYLTDPSSRANGSVAAAGVHAAQSYRTARAVDIMLRALSSPDPAASALAANWLKTNLDAQKAIDALFRYMAAKDNYSMREINVYVDLITSFKTAASPLVVQNLEALLAEAKSPEKVFWAHKVVAMSALQTIGTKDAAATVQKFVADPGSYYSSPASTDPNDVLAASKAKKLTFKSLAERTLGVVSAR